MEKNRQLKFTDFSTGNSYLTKERKQTGERRTPLAYGLKESDYPYVEAWKYTQNLIHYVKATQGELKV